MEYKTSVFYAGGGSTYTFPFEYLQKSFVKVRYQKPDGAFQNLEFGKDYTVEENRVNLTTASDSTYKVNIYRSTPTDRMVKYVDASILKAHDMNVNELQTLHIMEEQTDYLTAYALFRGDNANVWEANTLRIINLATPLEPTDAVNKAYVDEYGVTWNQNVAQMKKQLQDQNTNITNQLDTQNRNITKQLADQQTLFNQQLSDQDTDFNGRIAAHDTELLNKVNTNNQKYKTELQTYNDGVVQQIHDDAGASAALAKKWAQDAGSPDNESDSVSPTGKTQSAKSWAEVAKSQAQASSTSAAEAKKSQSAASASEQNAESFMEAASTSANAALRSQEASASSESKAKASEDNAKQSELNAAESAKQAAAGQVNADWNETNADSKAYIKNKPDIANSVTTKALTVTGQTTVPTANAGNSSKAIANTEFVAKSISTLVNGAPDQLNTLNELAKALGNDSNFASTVTAELAKKLNSAEAESTYATKQEAGVPYQIKRNTAYKVGDVLTSPSLPPGCVIVVTQAGTTGSTEPDWTTIKSNMGGVISDGTVTFYINDTLSKHSIGDIVYKPTTKTGEHEYLLPLDGQTIDGTKYKRLVDYMGSATLPNLNGRYLRADSTPGQMVDAGLPNITGKFQKIYTLSDPNVVQGAFSLDDFTTDKGPDDNSNKGRVVISFDASLSNPIYGKSTTVTPLTYTVRAYICYA